MTTFTTYLGAATYCLAHHLSLAHIKACVNYTFVVIF
jgi:hypothetical protein